MAEPGALHASLGPRAERIADADADGPLATRLERHR